MFFKGTALPQNFVDRAGLDVDCGGDFLDSYSFDLALLKDHHDGHACDCLGLLAFHRVQSAQVVRSLLAGLHYVHRQFDLVTG